MGLERGADLAEREVTVGARGPETIFDRAVAGHDEDDALRKHRVGAERVGLVARTATAAIITLLVALWSDGRRQVASAALIGARAFVVVGPGLIVAFVIRRLQRSEHA